MSDLLEWVERAAIESLRTHHATADILAKESATTLTVLLAGMAGAFAYSAKAVEANSWGWFSISAVEFAAYIGLLCLWLVLGCLKIKDIPAIYNEPKNLLSAGVTFTELRRYELENMQKRIDDAIARNNSVATTLNRIRLAAVLSPLVFGVTSFVVA